MIQTSRNAPCPCGSGKKYKKCCLPLDAEKHRPQKTYHDYCLEVVDSLRDKVLKFVHKARYDRFIQEAFDFYWQTLEPDLEPPALTPPWYTTFLEWFIHDFPIPPHDRPVIQLFLESKPLLPAEEMQILKDWQDAHISVFQVKEVKPEEGVLAEDIFTGEEVFISDYSLSRQARKWEIMTIRKVKVLDEWQASGVGSKEDPKAKGEIYDFVMELFRLYRKSFRGVQLQDFLRWEGFVLHQRLLTLEASPQKLPKLLTSGGEELTFWEARYDLINLPEAALRLQSQEDFEEAEWQEDSRGRVKKVFFNWLEKGKSSGKNKAKSRQTGIVLSTAFTTGPGEESFRVLGNIVLETNSLTLEAQGEKRFAFGKKRLETVLSGLLKHRRDTVKTAEEMMQEPREEEVEDFASEIPSEMKQAILKDMLDQHYQKWLDTPLSALKNKSPRKAISTQEGRRMVEDLLRSMEYHHQQKDMEYDITWIRKELGME